MVMAIARRPKRAKCASLRSLLPPYVVHGGVMCDGCSKVVVGIWWRKLNGVMAG